MNLSGSLIFFVICCIVFAFRIYLRVAMWMSKYDEVSKDMPDSLEKRNSLYNMLHAYFRRRRVLKQKKHFVYIDGNLITLKNRLVSLVLDTKNKVINCVDNKNKSRYATVIWSEQLYYSLEKYDNYFERVFDNICFSFDSSSNYLGVLDYLKMYFKVEETNIPTKTESRMKKVQTLNLNTQTKFMQENTELININTASSEELSKLPGINIIIAKKIVKYRDLHSGFKSKEEFFKEIKLKEHFKRQIENAITIKTNTKQNKNTDTRIVDL